MFMGLCSLHSLPSTLAVAYLLLVARADVEHGHGAVGGAVARHELLLTHVWGVERWRCRCRTPRRSHVCGRRWWHNPCHRVNRLETQRGGKKRWMWTENASNQSLRLGSVFLCIGYNWEIQYLAKIFIRLGTFSYFVMLHFLTSHYITSVSILCDRPTQSVGDEEI